MFALLVQVINISTDGGKIFWEEVSQHWFEK